MRRKDAVRKKRIAGLLGISFAAACLAGCGQKGLSGEANAANMTNLNAGRTHIVQAAARNGDWQGTSGSATRTASSGEAPEVYMTGDVSSDALMAVYEALEAAPEGRVAVKLSTGEPGSNYLRTDLIGSLVQSLGGTIVECNTAYGGSRANTAMHYQVAEDHGYTAIADVDILDEEGSLTLPVVGETVC